MPQPVTEIAKVFNAQCLSLADCLRELEAGNQTLNSQEKISKAVDSFFDSVQRLYSQIVSSEIRDTILFEIDRTLSGAYGSKVFKAMEGTTPTHKLFRDLAALWQRYFLIANLARSDIENENIAGTMSFYEDWLKTENVGVQESEYDRIINDVTILINDARDLNISTKIHLFSMMGKILMLLGVTEDFAGGRLQNYADEIKHRTTDKSTTNYSEILMGLQVYNALGKNSQETTINSSELEKAIRFWSSKDDFTDQLFKSWDWRHENNYTSTIAMGDQIYLKERSPLFLSWANQTMKLGVGHSFLELEDYKQKNPNLIALFQPVPIFIFGHSGVGKSCILSAFCYEAQMRTGNPVTLGREFQVFYENTSDSWHSGKIKPTTGYQSYTFWRDLNVTSFSIYDYGGKDTQPDQWEQSLQDLFRKARGLFFLIDDQDYLDPIKLRKRANWFDAILQYWTQSNPHIRHVPVGLILTKCDLIFGDHLNQLKRCHVVPLSFQPAIIEAMLPNRFPQMSEILKTSFGRLRDCILTNRENNVHPILQDILQSLFDNFGQFFSRLIDLTYHYQIFITSAIPPREVNDQLFPYGAKDSIMWMLDTLEKFHIRESLQKFKTEESSIETEIKSLREDSQQLQRYREEIIFANSEITRLRSKPTIFQVTMKDRIKYHEENKARIEQDLMMIVNKHVKEKSEATKMNDLQIVEQEMRKKEATLSTLKEKRNEYESKLKI